MHAVRDSSSEEFTGLLLELVRKRTTLQPSISQLDLMLENVLQTRCHDLTSAVDQIKKYKALQPLNVQPLFLTGNHAVQLLSPLSNKFEMCTNPQPVHNVLNNIRKLNSLWRFGFGITAYEVFSSSTPKLYRLVRCKYIILHNKLASIIAS